MTGLIFTAFFFLPLCPKAGKQTVRCWGKETADKIAPVADPGSNTASRVLIWPESLRTALDQLLLPEADGFIMVFSKPLLFDLIW
jgi:hypothetical protein